MNYDNKNYMIFSPHSKISGRKPQNYFLLLQQTCRKQKKIRNEFSILVLIFWGGGFFISAFFYLVLMFVLFHRSPAVVPAAPPPPPPAQGGQGPGFYSAAQKYTESEEKPSSSQLQSRSFKFLQGMMDSGQGRFILPNKKKSQRTPKYIGTLKYFIIY